MPSPCPFCERINRGDYRFDFTGLDVVSFTPLNPVCDGHRLFVPRRHVEWSAEQGTGMVLGDLTRASTLWASMRNIPHNLIVNIGADATQTVPHLHLHFLPRQPGDGVVLPWTTQKLAVHPEPTPAWYWTLGELEENPMLLQTDRADVRAARTYVDNLRHEVRRLRAQVSQ